MGRICSYDVINGKCMWNINGKLIVKYPLERRKWSWKDNIRHEISGSRGCDYAEYYVYLHPRRQYSATL
jgi:hypothetical protein